MTIGQQILLGAFNRNREVQLTVSQYHLFNRLSVKHNKYIYIDKQSDIDKANKAEKLYLEANTIIFWN